MTVFTRRQILAAMSSSPLIATGTVAAAADADGYGEGGYGEGGYGGSTDDDIMAPDPTIDTLNAEDASNPKNPHCDAHIEWAASIDENGSGAVLDRARVVVTDTHGEEVMAWETHLIGTDASQSVTDRIHHGGGETYTVTVTVSSDQNTHTADSTTFTSPGKRTGKE